MSKIPSKPNMPGKPTIGAHRPAGAGVPKPPPAAARGNNAPAAAESKIPKAPPAPAGKPAAAKPGAKFVPAQPNKSNGPKGPTIGNRGPANAPAAPQSRNRAGTFGNASANASKVPAAPPAPANKPAAGARPRTNTFGQKN